MNRSPAIGWAPVFNCLQIARAGASTPGTKPGEYGGKGCTEAAASRAASDENETTSACAANIQNNFSGSRRKSFHTYFVLKLIHEYAPRFLTSKFLSRLSICKSSSGDAARTRQQNASYLKRASRPKPPNTGLRHEQAMDCSCNKLHAGLRKQKRAGHTVTAITSSTPLTRGGRVPPKPRAGAVGAIPPRETLRHPYRHDEANLESSKD